MIARDALVAGVLAATDKVVQQATVGDWQAALDSSRERRLLLEQLSQQESQAGEHGFLRALREAAAESEEALAKMRTVAASDQSSNPSSAPNSNRAGNRLCTKA